MFLTGAIAMLLGPYVPGTLLWLYLIGFFVYIWRSLAVVGETGAIMSGLRFFIILMFWVFMITFIMLATVIVSGLSVQA